MPYRFSYDSRAEDKHFECTLSSQRCEGITGKGKRCKKQVTLGIPMCYAHLRKHHRLSIAKSGVHGLGVFAYDALEDGPVFESGKKITEYAGETLTGAEIDARYGGNDSTAPYAMLVYRPAARRGVDPHRESISVDAACHRGVSSFVNEARRAQDVNCKYVTDRNRANPRNNKKVLVATKDIYHGEELLVSYGEAYVHDNNDNSTKYVRPRARR